MSLFLGKVCSNIMEFEEFEGLYKDLSLKDKDFIEGTTGCLYPCTYLEYRSTLFLKSHKSHYRTWSIMIPPHPGLVTEKPQAWENLDCGSSLGP